MQQEQIENPNPIIFEIKNLFNKDEQNKRIQNEVNLEIRDEFDKYEVFEIIRHVNDPEHPLTLEQLNVVGTDRVSVDDQNNDVYVQFTPTIPHCSQAAMIGLMLKVKLSRSLPSRFKTIVKVQQGTHLQEEAINKQINDKERVCAAIENPHILNMLNNGLTGSDRKD